MQIFRVKNGYKYLPPDAVCSKIYMSKNSQEKMKDWDLYRKHWCSAGKMLLLCERLK